MIRSALMPTPEDRAKRRDRQSAEIEISQAKLRDSIAETGRLVDESDKMLRRHRKECEDGDAAALRKQRVVPPDKK
jgi:hypothetical protein